MNIFTYPLIASFFSLVFAKRLPMLDDSQTRDYGSLTVVIVEEGMLLLMAALALWPRVFIPAEIGRIAEYVKTHPQIPSNQYYVCSNKLEILVTPDDVTPDPLLPSMTLKTFKDRYVKFTRAPNEFLLEHLPDPPFYVLNSPPIMPKRKREAAYNDYNEPPGDSYFIAPPEVLRNKDVLLWDFSTNPPLWDDTEVPWWYVVKKATPFLFKEQS